MINLECYSIGVYVCDITVQSQTCFDETENLDIGDCCVVTPK